MKGQGKPKMMPKKSAYSMKMAKADTKKFEGGESKNFKAWEKKSGK